MRISLLIILLLAFSFSSTKRINPEKVTLAINCGSFEGTQGSQGFAYQPDKSYSKSRNVDYQTNEEYANLNILYSYDQAVYKTERHYDETFGYQLDLKEEGTYVLILKFCEMYFKYPNSRLFNIKIGEKQVVKDLDIVKIVGSQAAYDEYIEFEFKNNQIYFKNQVCANAYDKETEKFTIEIEKGAKDLPLLNGIVLLKGKLDETDYYEQESLRIEWKSTLEEQKRLELEEKKKKLLTKQQLLKNVKDDEFKTVKEERRIAGLKRILTTNFGVAIIGTLLIIIFLLTLFQDEKIKQQ